MTSKTYNTRDMRRRTIGPMDGENRFDRTYKDLETGGQTERECVKRIDYVLVHYDPKQRLKAHPEEKEKIDKAARLRSVFEGALIEKGFVIKRKVIGKRVYKRLHCSFRALCEEAEKVNLEMPLNDEYCENFQGQSKKKTKDNCFASCLSKTLRIFEPEEIEDYESTIFSMDRIHIFRGYKDRAAFFRPSIRSFLVDHILINLDIRDKLKPEDISDTKSINDNTVIGCCDFRQYDEENGENNKKSSKMLQKIAFPYLKYKGVYESNLVLHEMSKLSKEEEDWECPFDDITYDPRAELDRVWCKFYKFQPLTKIRDYFGEKISFYFAWCGALMTSLWIPTLLGFAIFLYGLQLSIRDSLSEVTTTTMATINTTILTTEPPSVVSSLLDVIKKSFDNEATPFFALIICLWGTVFLEYWKRESVRLAYLWDVQEFEANEPDRPEFFGTEHKKDKVSGLETWIFPKRRQRLRFLISFFTLMTMVLLVLISVMGVIVYRTIASVDYCPSLQANECLLVTTICSSLLNSISILILGKFYDVIARKLTDWENHRTRTQYDDALIVKLFAFQFANNYASCFYIAFFRGRFDNDGILGLGANYTDKCEGTCMSQLSFQILTNMLTKPLPKLFSDVIIPKLKKIWRKRPNSLRCCGSDAVDNDEDDIVSKAKQKRSELDFLENELVKETLKEFTLSEYTEKVIQYGYLMLFAASFPLAPLIALLLLLFDIRVDADRLLWNYKRPVARIAQDIGTWYVILQAINFAGVISNGFLIAFTSSFGSNYSIADKLWIVIGFEHICFALKFLLAYLIPDIPADVMLKKRKKKYRWAQITEKDDKEDAMKTAIRGLPEHLARYAESLSQKENENQYNFSRNKEEANTRVRKIKRKKKKTHDDNNDDYDKGYKIDNYYAEVDHYDVPYELNVYPGSIENHLVTAEDSYLQPLQRKHRQ